MSDKQIYVTRRESLVTSPDLIIGYRAGRQPRTIVHDLIGGAADASLIPARLRSGTLTLFYLDKTTAEAAHALLALPEMFTLSSTLPGSPYSIPFFVVTETLDIELDTETGTRWLVSVTYRELAG